MSSPSTAASPKTVALPICTHAEIIAEAAGAEIEHEGSDGIGEDRIDLWYVAGVLVVETNGAAVWPDDAGYAELREAIERGEPAPDAYAASLEGLFAAMLANDPAVLDSHGGWSSDLPNFGGRPPTNTEGVWSWDADRRIVGSCAADIAIEPRDDHGNRERACVLDLSKRKQ